ncbi:hypothetical protein A9Q98_13270 [Thalassotalea sp. 42_200_T64]|nr:hypothetical protein A9Q98_13270 [Thalassotalea sp. 42_200_T64]
MVGFSTHAKVSSNSLNLNDNSQLQFTNLDDVEILSHPAVNTIVQDKMGFIWLGNQNGLNRFDGISSKIYTHIQGDSNSLASTWVYKIFVDSEERLWVLGNGGISLYLPEIDAFQNFNNKGQFKGILGNKYRAVAEDINGSLWFGSRDKGISTLDVTTSNFTTVADLSSESIFDLIFDSKQNLWVATEKSGLRVKLAGQDHFQAFTTTTDISIPTNKIQTIFEDQQHVFWVATEDSGVFQFDLQTGVSKSFTYQEHDNTSLCSNYVRDIYQDSKGIIWFATDNGLCQFESYKQSFIRHNRNNARVNSLIDDRVISLYQDSGGVMWVGTFSGISRWNAELTPFTHVSKNFDADNGLSSNVIAAITEDSAGNVYVGTWGGGLNIIEAATGKINIIQADKNDPTALQDDRVMSLLFDSEDNLWLGTYGSGLHFKQKGNSTFTVFKHQVDNLNSLSSNAVSKIIELENGVLAVATFGGGLNLIQNGNILRIMHDEQDANSISSNKVIDIVQENKQILWIATRGGGINRFNLATGNNTRFMVDDNNKDSIASNNVVSLLSTSDYIWIATEDFGISRISRSEFELGIVHFEHVGINQGLPSNVGYGIVEDEAGFIWLSHTRGLSRISPIDLSINNFNKTHGLQGNDFNAGAYYKSKKGRIYFGGANGFNTFMHDNVPINQNQPPLRLTKFSKFNQPVAIHKMFRNDGVLQLEHSDSFLEFEFAALDYTKPENNKYQYMMQGFNTQWIDSGNINRTTFSSLPHGNYIFRVRGSNNDGQWSEDELSLAIEVTPPLWLSWPAYLFYLAIILLMAYFIHRNQQIKLQKQIAYQEQLKAEVNLRTKELQTANAALELAVVETHSAKVLAEKAANTKANFLATMSHEIRTPMNSIIGMSDLLLKTGLNRSQNHFVTSVQNAGEMLLELINDILDFSKMEADKTELEQQRFNIHHLLEEVSFLFANRAHSKGVELTLYIDVVCAEMINADPLRIKQVISNLLGNAIKFTETGHIELTATSVNNELIIEVSDTGIGISTLNQSKIFQVFQQEDNSTTRKYGGTGLGLAITKKLVEIMSGNISVVSTPGSGSTFTVTLPLAAVDAAALPAKHIDATVYILATNQYINRMAINTLQRIKVNYKDISAQTNIEVDSNDNRSALYLVDAEMLKQTHIYKQLSHHVGNVIIMANSGENVDLIAAARSIDKPLRSQALLELLEDCLTGDCSSDKHKALPLVLDVEEFKAHILLVEDSETNQEVATAMLQLFGCEVEIASNGVIAIEKVQHNHYDLIFMDCQMPVMDGFKASQMIRKWQHQQKLKATPIVALTAGVGLGYEKDCITAGMNSYIYKPLTTNVLLSVLKKYLNHLIVKSTELTEIDHALCSFEATEQPKEPHEYSAESKFDCLIDTVAIDAIREIEKVTNRAIYSRVLETFKLEYVKKSNSLKVSLANNDNDSDNVKRIAHAMKSLCANVGAKELSNLSVLLEQGALKGSQDECHSLATKMDIIYQETIVLLEDIAREVV